ncbi:hypothetical protein [Pedobacter cryotolerans]|nr:hypothetical protein [Pedobacter cryotolerans]
MLQKQTHVEIDDFYNNYIITEYNDIDEDAWLKAFDDHQKYLDEMGY